MKRHSLAQAPKTLKTNFFQADSRIAGKIFRDLAPSEILEMGSYSITIWCPIFSLFQKSLHPIVCNARLLTNLTGPAQFYFENEATRLLISMICVISPGGIISSPLPFSFLLYLNNNLFHASNNLAMQSIASYFSLTCLRGFLFYLEKMIYPPPPLFWNYIYPPILKWIYKSKCTYGT